MTSSAAGNNVLTKSDTGNNFLTNFQPMSKRLMVWDKEKHNFIPYDSNFCLARDEDNELYLCDIDWQAKDLVETDINRFILIYSTNLFDKDGKEIFEGSIVEDEFNETLGYVYYEPKACAWRIKFNNGEEDDGWTLENSTSNLRILGHILSNPELLEENNV